MLYLLRTEDRDLTIDLNIYMYRYRNPYGFSGNWKSSFHEFTDVYIDKYRNPYVYDYKSKSLHFHFLITF